MGGVSVYSTGMTPGFALDLWPVTMARTVRRVDSVHVRELVSLRDYKSTMQEFMGFGLRPGEEIAMFKMFEESSDNPKAGALNTPYGAALHFLGDAFGVEIDKITYQQIDVRTDQRTHGIAEWNVRARHHRWDRVPSEWLGPGH